MPLEMDARWRRRVSGDLDDQTVGFGECLGTA